MAYDISNIKRNLSMTADAVNGMLTAKNEQEKVAWVTIYNSRMTQVFAELEIIKELEPKIEEPETVIPIEKLKEMKSTKKKK